MNEVHQAFLQSGTAHRRHVVQSLELLPAHLIEFIFRLSPAPLAQKLYVLPEALYKQAVLATFPSVTKDRQLVLEGSREGKWLPAHAYMRLFCAVSACNKLKELSIDCWFLKAAFSEPSAMETFCRCISSMHRLQVLKLRRLFYAVPDLNNAAPRLLCAAVATLHATLQVSVS